jgi:hypothetical protein
LDTHFIPAQVPALPANWKASYKELSVEAGLSIQDLQTGLAAVHGFLDPVLSGVAIEKWNPDTWKWE